MHLVLIEIYLALCAPSTQLQTSSDTSLAIFKQRIDGEGGGGDNETITTLLLIRISN